ncbi:hypothetical protein BH11ACT1_BH11ACT1_14110 [soil metagenome]
MKYELFDYQEFAVAAISKHLIRATRDFDEDPDERTAIVLAAPTGAGKTVIATSVIEASLDGDEATPGVEDATFLWVTDDPSLNRQTLQKMLDSSSDIKLNRLTIIESDFDEEDFAPGRVYFLNIQKLSANATLSKSRIDGRTFSLWETITNTIVQRPHGFVVVVDEAHRGTTAAAASGRARETIVSQIIGGGATGRPAAPVVWGISATPRRFLGAMADAGRTTKQHTVRIEDVRASGLLKEQIVLGHTQGVDAAESALVRFAVKRVRLYEQKWAAYTASTGEPAVHPALVIQVADKPTAAELGTLISTVLDEWPGVGPDAVVHTFADHGTASATGFEIPWCPPEDIQDRTDIRVVVCKTAITTGWDCPRAEVLLSFRVARDLDLITQIMGRMVRTPLARRIDTDQDLNAVHCILPKFDRAAVEAIAERFRVGDDETLATGAAVIVDAMELGRNPTLASPLERQWAALAEASGAAEEPFELASADDQGPAGPSGTPDLRPVEDRGRAATNAQSGTGQDRMDDLFSADQDPIGSAAASAPMSVFDIIAALPSYTIPRRTLRSPVDRLTQMAILLAGEHDEVTIDAKAPIKARAALLSVIDEHRAVLEESGELDDLVRGAGITRLFEHTVGFANPTASSTDTNSELVLDARGVQILMKRAEALLPQGLANAYVKRLAGRDDQIRQAQLTTIALAGDPTLPAALKNRASHIVEQWFRDYGGAITRLPAPEQERFDRIKRESDRPLLTTITLPSNKTESSTGAAWERHILSDAQGLYRTELQGWEEHVLRTELNAGAVAWYRNPSTGRHSLQIPYTTAGGINGLAPDFIFVDQVAGELVASLVDPHGTHLADAVDKLKGLAAYAATHPGAYHRIQSVALVDDHYLLLNHKEPQIRDAITTFEGTDSRELFRAHGTRY